MTVLFKTSGDQDTRILLQVLSGETSPDSGVLLIGDLDLKKTERERLSKVRHTIGIITAQSNLISNLKVWENITLPLLYHHGIIPPEIADQAMQLLEKFGLKNSLWSLPAHLSHPQRIIVAFIRAIIVAPRLLIYVDCFDDIPGLQRETFLQLITQIQQQDNAPAAVFITAGNLQLPHMQPNILCDLRQNHAQVMR